MTTTNMRAMSNWWAHLRGAVRLRRFRNAPKRAVLSGAAERLLRQHEDWLRAQGHQEGTPPALDHGAPDALWVDTNTGEMIFVVVAATEADMAETLERAEAFADYRNATVHVVASAAVRPQMQDAKVFLYQ